MITAVTVILSMPQYVLNFHAIFYPFCIIFYSPEPFSQPDRQIAGQSEQDWLRQDGWTVDYAAKTQRRCKADDYAPVLQRPDSITLNIRFKAPL